MDQRDNRDGAGGPLWPLVSPAHSEDGRWRSDIEDEPMEQESDYDERGAMDDYYASDGKDEYQLSEDEDRPAPTFWLPQIRQPNASSPNQLSRMESEETIVASGSESNETLTASETENWDEDTADDESTDFTQFFDLQQLMTHSSKKLRTDVTEYKAIMKNSSHLSGERMLFRLKHILKALLQQTIVGLSNDDYFRIIIQANGLKHPISISYTRVGDYDLDNIFHHIEKVLQSCDTVRLDSSFVINVARTYFPNPGAGRASGGIMARRIPDFEQWLSKKQCLITVPTNDKICGFRALVLGKALADGKRYSDIRYKERWQRTECDQLAQAAGLALYGGLSMEELPKLQEVLNDYQITIYEPDVTASDGLNVLFRGDRRQKNISLLLYNDHYYVVKSEKALRGQNYYCDRCYKAFSHAHRCSELCRFCQSPICANKSAQRSIFDAPPCAGCGQEFKTEHCIQGHTLEHCEQFGKCPECQLTWPRRKLAPERHQCMMRYCRACKCLRPPFVDHQCYIPSGRAARDDEDSPVSDSGEEADVRSKNHGREKRKLEHETLYVDFETGLCQENRHFASILCVLQEAKTGQQRIFEGANSAVDFVDYILGLDYRHTTRTVIAHYNQGFDVFCYLRILYEKRQKIEIISKGQKIICLSLVRGRCRMLDSILYLTMPLASFSSAFSITECCKGFFPYGLLRCQPGEDQAGLVERLKGPAPFPSRSEFDEDSMMPKRRAEFNVFYREASAHFANREYVPWKMLLDYCVDDVRTLRLGCERFRELYRETMGTDPFKTGITLTSANFHVFCKKFLPAEKIAIIGDSGLLRGLYSKMACVWLEKVAHENGIEIEHAGNKGERKIGIYKVDGFSKDPPRLTYRNRRWKPAGTCFQFHNCLFHGHTCIADRKKVFMNETMDFRYARTIRCEKYLRDSGFNVVVQWSCEFLPLMQRDPSLLEETRLAGALHPRLLPREGYFGGRVEGFKLYHECKANETIRYIDYNGLYPTVMLTGEFYCGVPRVIRNNFGDVLQYRGLVYGRFLANDRALFLPVLPCRENKKLYFTLCAECARSKNVEDCQHSDQQRAITTIVTTEELGLALKHGYSVLELFEVWHYPSDQRDDQIFKKFESIWMTVKAESSDWPPDVGDDAEARACYLRTYKERFGIEIDPTKVRKNIPMRTVAKLCGNALYGRLGLKSRRINVRVATEFDDLCRLLQDKNVEVKDIYMVNEDVSFVTWSYKEHCELVQDAVNLVMCIQVTSMARMMLYEALDAVYRSRGCRVLYTDTDSVIFSAPDDFVSPFECGDVLGQLKDEVRSDYPAGSWISEWFCTGSKSYSYVVQTPGGPKTMMKVKGFRLDYATKQKITREAIIEMVKDQEGTAEPIRIKYPRRVVREMKTGTMREVDTEKRFCMTADKRIFLPEQDFICVPYGFTRS